MIIVLLTYTGDVEPHREAHIAWLREARLNGPLMVAGRQPETGGVLIANGTREEVEAWAATDPYVARGTATNSFVEFTPSMAAQGLEKLLP